MDIAENIIVQSCKSTPDAIKKASVSSVAPQKAANTDCLTNPKNFIRKVRRVTYKVEVKIDLDIAKFLLVRIEITCVRYLF